MFIYGLDDTDSLKSKSVVMHGPPYKSMSDGKITTGRREADGSLLE